MFFNFDLFPILFNVVFVFILGLIIFTVVQGLLTWNKNNRSPRLAVAATVVTKRMNVTHNHTDTGTGMQGHSSTRYFATFQVESGDRLELCVPDREYGMLVEGDAGTLTFQGTRYLSFERK